MPPTTMTPTTDQAQLDHEVWGHLALIDEDRNQSVAVEVAAFSRPGCTPDAGIEVTTPDGQVYCLPTTAADLAPLLAALFPD